MKLPSASPPAARTQPAATIFVPLPRGLPPKMVSDYLEVCRKDVPQLKVALAAGEYQLARRLGHQMKGTGGAYGFPDLTQIGSAIERTAAARAAAELETQIQRLEAYLNSVEIAPAGDVR